MSKVGSGDSKNTLYCSFCGKSQHEVRKLIAGPTVFICNECVELCMDIIDEMRPFPAELMAEKQIVIRMTVEAIEPFSISSKIPAIHRQFAFLTRFGLIPTLRAGPLGTRIAGPAGGLVGSGLL
jgi:hypothetical protein